MTRPARAIDSLVNSSFLSPTGSGGWSYLSKGIAERQRIDSAEQLIEVLSASDVGALGAKGTAGMTGRCGRHRSRLPGWTRAPVGENLNAFHRRGA